MRAPEGFVEGVLRTAGLVDAYARVESAVGWVYVARSTKGITLVRRAESDAHFERLYRERFDRRVERRDTLAAELAAALTAGARVQVDLRGTSDFARAVLETTRRIKPGYIRPYAWVAQEVGREKAVRAVGSALAANPVPLVIPCHRVIRGDTTIGDYLFGTQEKEQLLAREGVDCSHMRELSQRHMRFVASKTTKIFCYPFCFPAQRILPKNLIELSSAREATARGFRPCKSCRSDLALL
ncbi:MAG TPA: methylated-DNA--[protein]-cysteine S-methyltransferase [Candidatus Baltobacteraceae bacterium]